MRRLARLLLLGSVALGTALAQVERANVQIDGMV